MLEAGSPKATAFFPLLDMKEIYHSTMSMFLSWLSSQYPSQYPLSAALHHRSQAIQIIRQRLSQGMHDDATYINILCSMQTDVNSVHVISSLSLLTETGAFGQRECFGGASERPGCAFTINNRGFKSVLPIDQTKVSSVVNF
jgi:hypothetical protein